MVHQVGVCLTDAFDLGVCIDVCVCVYGSKHPEGKVTMTREAGCE